jgi:hypothetical protein
MSDFWKSCGEANRPPRRLIGMSFRLGIPWQVALQQSLPPLSQPEPLCNHEKWSVEQFSADGTCLTDSVSQNSPQSTHIAFLENRIGRG